MSFSTAHALTYEQAETYSVCGVALTATDTVAESGDDGFVTTPTGSVILPDDEAGYIEVNGMETSGLGSAPEGVNILNQLKAAVDAFSDPNDLMYWYVTAGAKVNTCTSKSFQCDYNKDGVSVVLGVWLPQDANEVTISFKSQSHDMSMSVWSYGYEAASGEESFTLMYARNNDFDGHGQPGEPISYSKTISGNFTGQYIFFMFNTANGENNYLDIQGMDITYVPVNPFQPSLPSGDATVPEPSGAMLSLLALATLAARRRRR